jgi:predicted membrane protein
MTYQKVLLKEFIMQNRGQVLVGSSLVLFGGGLLLASLLHINFWAICFPMTLIMLGVFFLIARPPMWEPTTAGNSQFVGDIVRSGEYTVTGEEFRLFVGDVRLDMTRAQFPVGETVIRLSGFVYDASLTVPDEVGVTLVANGFVVDTKLGAQHSENFLSGIQLGTANYALAERRLRVVMNSFVGNLRVDLRPGMAQQAAPVAPTIVENGATAVA